MESYDRELPFDDSADLDQFQADRLAGGLGEFGAVITFAANIPGRTQTLPLAIYTALQVPGGEATAAKLRLSPGWVRTR